MTSLQARPVAPKTPKVDEDSEKRKIVQTERGRTVKDAPKDAYLGERNQVVDREIVSSRKMTKLGDTHQPNPAQGKEGVKELAKKAEPASVIPSIGSLGVPIISHLKQLNEQPAGNDQARWAQVGQLPQDYVQGLREGDRTALNTREYVFFGYFQRIRERLDRAWVPILREKLVRHFRTGRQLASDTNYTTRVLVILNNGGEIVRVQVVSESGTHDLDEAAIRAFNRAGPFPNPPKGIIDANGEIQIPWEFILRT